MVGLTRPCFGAFHKFGKERVADHWFSIPTSASGETSYKPTSGPFGSHTSVFGLPVNWEQSRSLPISRLIGTDRGQLPRSPFLDRVTFGWRLRPLESVPLYLDGGGVRKPCPELPRANPVKIGFLDLRHISLGICSFLTPCCPRDLVQWQCMHPAERNLRCEQNSEKTLSTEPAI